MTVRHGRGKESAMSAVQQARPSQATPFERIGGRPPIEDMVDRFYDLMDSEPSFAPLRAIHRGDLAPMREKLSDFLTAWMGAPPRLVREKSWRLHDVGPCGHSGDKS